MSNTPALEWSSQVRVANPSSLSQPLSGDKITLPPSALEQLLSASTKWAAESARRDLPAYDPFNSATHFAYRQAESQYEDQRQQLPHPLTFRLVNAENGRVVYAGIREFSAAEGEVALSPFLREALEIRADSMSHGEIATLADDEALADVSQADPRPQITIHARQLPKGTFVKLRPLAAGYDVDDWKALLEQHLRKNYTTLTNGEILIVPGSHGTGGKKEEFRFLVDGFKPEVDAICVVDTDLEVDIEALNEEQARETLRRIAAKTALAPGTEQGSTIGGDLDLFKAQQGRVLPGEYVDYILPSWNRTLPIEIELEAQGETESLGLLVSPLSSLQRSKPRIDAFVLAELDSRPRKRIRLEPGAIQIEDAEAMFVTVFAFGDSQITSEDAAPAASTDNAPILFSLRASHPDAISADGTAPDEAAERIAAGEVRCKNCGHWVPQARLPLHEATCYRNNILCPKGCGQVFQKRSVEYERHWHCAHDLSYGNAPESLHHHNFVCHPVEVLRCDECSTSETFSTRPALARHRTSTCPGKLILCRFCHLEVPQEGDPDIPNAEALLTGLTPHELADGARTTECHLCNKLVRLRDMATHLKNHDHDRRTRPSPRPCRNILCGRTLDVCSLAGDTRAGLRQGQGAGNDIGLCATCFGPLYVSMHDPEGKALRRRIERRYLAQLLTGCGKGWCRNELCRTGRKALGVGDGAALTTKDALPLIKPFLAGATDVTPATPLHFCVDEASQRRRDMAAMMAGDPGVTGNGGYTLEWCIGALEATNGDLDAAQTWLQNWAPSRAEIGH
jgi:hypothetical protein